MDVMDNFRIWDVKIYDPIGHVLRFYKVVEYAGFVTGTEYQDHWLICSTVGFTGDIIQYNSSIYKLL